MSFISSFSPDEGTVCPECGSTNIIFDMDIELFKCDVCGKVLSIYSDEFSL